MTKTIRVTWDYIGASEADQMHALSAAINARCEATERVVAAAREIVRAATTGGWIYGDLVHDLEATLAALDALPPVWQDQTAKVRTEGGS